MVGRDDRDRGLTLVELLLVTALVGVVVTVIAAAFMVITRVSPSNEARIDDARSLLGVTTYLPEDVNSTPPDSFEFARDRTAADAGCLGATADNLVEMSWTEQATTYRAGYRYEPAGGGRVIVRYSCIQGAGTTDRQVLSSELPAAFDAVDVTPVPDSFARTVGLDLEVRTIDGKLLTVDARSNNPAVSLPPVVVGSYPPAPSSNTAPIAQPVATNTEPGLPRDVFLKGVDADGDIMTASVSGVPSGWDVDVTGQIATVTPPSDATPLDVVTFDYTVVDPYGQAATSMVSVTIVATATNSAPVAGPFTGTATAETPFVANLSVLDGEGDPLTITLDSVDPSLTVVVYNHSLIITSDGSTADPPAFNYTATDPGGLSSTSTVDLDVVVCQIVDFYSSESDGTIERRGGNKRLTGDVTFTVDYTGPCTDLVMEYDHDLGPSGTDYNPIYLSFGSGSEVTVDGHPGGLTPWTLGPHTMTLRNGLVGPSLGAVVLEVVEE